MSNEIPPWEAIPKITAATGVEGSRKTAERIDEMISCALSSLTRGLVSLKDADKSLKAALMLAKTDEEKSELSAVSRRLRQVAATVLG